MGRIHTLRCRSHEKLWESDGKSDWQQKQGELQRRGLPVFRTQLQDLHCCCWSVAMNWPFLTDCKTDQSYPLLFTFSNPPDALVTLHSTLLVGSDKWWKKRLWWWMGEEETHQFSAQSAPPAWSSVIGYLIATQLDSLQKQPYSPLVHIFTLGCPRSTQCEINVVDKECWRVRCVQLSHMPSTFKNGIYDQRW